jgi:hypothetical protein
MDQLNTDLTAVQTAVDAVKADVAALATPAVDPSVAVVDSMVTALETAGYTVTAPAVPELESGTEDATDTSAEA